jgi:hypothetical protein
MTRAVSLILAVLLPATIVGCASPQVVMMDAIKPPITLGPIHRIGVIIWPVHTQEQRLLQGTLIRNLKEIPGLHPVAISLMEKPTPLSIPELAHSSQSNDLLLVHILSHTVMDKQVIAGHCPAPPCFQSINVPMATRTNEMRLHIVFLRAFPFHVELDRIVSVKNQSKKVSFSLFQRHFTPQTILNLHLYAKISQHVRYLFSTLRFKVKRPFYPYNLLTDKAYRSLQSRKPVLALFFLNSEYGRLVRERREIPYKFYVDLGVTYEYLRTYSLAEYYYRKASEKKKSNIFRKFQHQMQSMMVYFIGINFFEKGE